MKHLPECLESVKWADAVLVLHSGEGEPSVGSDPCSSLVVRKAASVKELRQLAREIKTDWILHLWGEERVEKNLKEQLGLLHKGKLPDTPAGYRIPIRSHLLGRWVEGSLWDPSPSLRLCRAAASFSFGWWELSERRNKEISGLLEGWIGDYALSDLSDGIERIGAISDLWAEYLQNQGRILSPGAMATCSFQVFMHVLLKNGGLFNGLAGLTLSVLAAYVVLLGGAKSWEARNDSGKKVTGGYG